MGEAACASTPERALADDLRRSFDQKRVEVEKMLSSFQEGR